MFTLSRVVRTFGTEDGETRRYVRNLGKLRRISVRLATAYLLYLVTNASLFNLTKVRSPSPMLACAGWGRTVGSKGIPPAEAAVCGRQEKVRAALHVRAIALPAFI